jgi:hypothetical protein
VEILAALAGIVSVLTCWVIGLRLLALARRNHGAPELFLGTGLLLTGGLWSPLIAIGRQATALSEPVRGGLIIAGACCAIPGISCLALFNWRVFRPGERWGGVLAGAVAAVLAAIFTAQSHGAGWFRYASAEQGPWILATWVAAANYLWSNLEAWQHYGMLVRRRRLGLSDPVVTDRVRLWALAMLAAIVASSVLGTCQILGIPVGGTSLGLSLTAATALFTAGCLWLAFMPPSSYLASIRRRAAVEA